MIITRLETFSREKLLQSLKQTRLKGHGQALVYEKSRLELVEQVDPDQLYPAQRYVLKEQLETVYHLFHKLDVDIFNLDGGILFWVDEKGPIPLTPPLVENSKEPDGRIIPLINDGMHRVYAAKRLGKKINCVMVHEVPEKWPYYAFALENGWDGVREMDELPKGFAKKRYRNPKNHKDLFRDFNAIFPGIQKKRGG